MWAQRLEIKLYSSSGKANIKGSQQGTSWTKLGILHSVLISYSHKSQTENYSYFCYIYNKLRERENVIVKYYAYT